MSLRVPKTNPTPSMVDRMLNQLLKPVPFWSRLGKTSRARKIYAQEISDAYKSEFLYGRKILQLCLDLQKLNEEFGEDLSGLKVKVNELVKQALAEDISLDGILQ